VKRMTWLAPAFILAFAAPALFAGYGPHASLAQQGPGGGCYICGTLDYVLIDGAYWFGIIAEDACPSYLNDPRSSPQARRSYYNQVVARGTACPTAERVRNSGYGTYCGENMPEKGAVFAAGTTLPMGRTYSEPSTDAGITGTYPNGTRMVYTQTKQVNGQTWYRVAPPGRPAGWMPGSEVSCTRPGEPYQRGPGPVLHDDGSTPRPTAATVAGARG
jgi:hypothetical protein